jgi:ubiquinone/menaquinone biosynthesis C-methylase UbiE
MFPFGFFFRRENNALASLIKRVPMDRGIVTDLGTGLGNALSFIQSDFTRIGIDLNLNMLKFAKRRNEGYYIQSDVLTTAIKNESADIVLMCGVWEYIKDHYALLSEIKRIMKRNSYAVITYSPPRFLTRLRIFFGLKIYPITEEHIREYLLENGFEIMALSRCMLQHQLLIKKSEANGTSQI